METSTKESDRLTNMQLCDTLATMRSCDDYMLRSLEGPRPLTQRQQHTKNTIDFERDAGRWQICQQVGKEKICKGSDRGRCTCIRSQRPETARRRPKRRRASKDGRAGGARWDDLRRAKRQARAHSAANGQSARPCHRCHRHRQDGHVAGPGGRLLAQRRAGVRRRHQGRSLRHRHDGRAEKTFLVERAAEDGPRISAGAFPTIFWDLFGEAGPSDPRHDLRNGAAAAVAAARAERHAGRRPQHRVPDCRRSGSCAARLQGSARDSGGDRAVRHQEGGEEGTATRSSTRSSARSQAMATSPADRRHDPAALLVLENQGAEKFFGEPALELRTS